jgi:hypothetical protein
MTRYRLNYRTFRKWNDPTGSGRAAILLVSQMKRAYREADKPLSLPDPLCTTRTAAEQKARMDAIYLDHAIPEVPEVLAPFTGTPYDANSEED